jgi:hypothetical protein
MERGGKQDVMAGRGAELSVPEVDERFLVESAVDVKASRSPHGGHSSGLFGMRGGPGLVVLGTVEVANGQASRDEAGDDGQATDTLPRKELAERYFIGRAFLERLPEPNGRLLAVHGDDRPAAEGVSESMGQKQIIGRR